MSSDRLFAPDDGEDKQQAPPRSPLARERASGDEAYCRCEREKPYTVPNWDVWVSDRKRAFCRSCGLDLHPAAARQWYARAQAAQQRVAWRFPGIDQQVPPPEREWSEDEAEEFIAEVLEAFPGARELRGSRRRR